MSKICMFCGDNYFYNKRKTAKTVKEIITDLVENEDVNTFYSGGVNTFDKMCEDLVRELKKTYPNLKLCLFLPYISIYVSRNIARYNILYDEITEIKDLHISSEDKYDPYMSFALKLDMWMVDRSDYLITNILRNEGRSYKTFVYADKKKINIKDVTIV